MLSVIGVVLAAEKPKIAGGDLVGLAAATFVLLTALVVVFVVARRKIKSMATPAVVLTPLPLPRTRTGDEDEGDFRIATIKPVSNTPGETPDMDEPRSFT